VQIIASDAFGGSDLPHPSQDGRSSSIRTPHQVLVSVRALTNLAGIERSASVGGMAFSQLTALRQLLPV